MKAKYHIIPEQRSMSKPLSPHILVLLAVIGSFLAIGSAAAQEMDVTIIVTADQPQIARIEGRFTRDAQRSDRKTFFLAQELDGSAVTSGRTAGLELSLNGRNIEFRRIAAATYLAEDEFDSWKYLVDISPGRAGAAHISRSVDASGVLMLDELLPIVSRNRTAKVRIRVPPGWKTFSTEVRGANGEYIVNSVENAVFVIGTDWRFSAKPGRPAIAILGKWHFSDDEAADQAVEIYDHFERVFGGRPDGGALVVIAPQPKAGAYGDWEADTRGRTVNILLTDAAFPTQSKQRIHEILRHEIFHLWLPNGVALTGDYSWFYEGAALYASLRAGVELNRIRFEDMLDTLSQAHRIEISAPEKRSLIAMSDQNRTGNDSRLYARGMLAAFIIDVELLAASGGKRSFGTLLRDIYLKHRKPAAVKPATQAILSFFGSHPEISSTVSSYVSGDKRIDWQQAITKAGLVNTGGKLAANARPSGKQKAMLDKLGYNAWRRFIRTK